MKVHLFVNAWGELTTEEYNPAYDKYDYEEDMAQQQAYFAAFCDYMDTAAVDNDDFEPLDEEDLEPLDYSRDDDLALWDDLDAYDDLYPSYGPLWDT